MRAQRYKTKSGTEQFRPVLTEQEYRHLTSVDMPGFCLACGIDVDGVEPDARGYRCESCSMPKVYGLEELLMMGLLTFADERA